MKEDIWVLARIGDGDAVAEAHTTAEAADMAAERDDYSWGVESVRIDLHRPDLRPIYGGPTLTEALWAEMDRLMEGLMTDTTADDPCGKKGCWADDPTDPCPHPDNGDKYRAQELAWVLAITSNPYAPSVDEIRAEAVTRWNAQEDFMTRPEGADQ